MTGLALKSKDSLVVMKTKKRLSHGCEKVFPRSLVLPSIDTSSNKQLDIMEVQQLESELEVVSRPSLAIERLLRGRRERHEDAVRDMREAMRSVNGILEKEVRRESDGLLGELEDIDKAMDIALKSVQRKDRRLRGGTPSLEQECNMYTCQGLHRVNSCVPHEKNVVLLQVPNLEEEAFSHCWEQIRILSNKKKECIKEYRERVVELENSRSDRIKEILKKHYGELREVHHLLPHDLQNFFEHEILKINQLILNNMRCYDDVTSHLTSIGDKKMLETLNHLDYRKRKGLIRKKDLDNLDSRKSTSKLEDAEATSLKTEAGQDITRRFTMEEKQVEDLISQWPGQITFSLDEAEDWTERVRHTIHKLDACATELMKQYKEAVNKIVVGLYARLEDLDSDNIFQNNLFNKIKIKEVGDMILSGDILQDMHKELTDQITQAEDVWRDVINMLTQNLQETFKFLRESGALWGRHKARVRAIHEVVLAALEHRFIESEFGRQELEARLNLALDQLRQESVEDRLDKELREVWGILDTIKSMYEKNYSSEMETVNKYLELTEVEAEVVISDIQRFLERFPKGKIPQEYYEREEYLLNVPKVIPRQMKMCEYHVCTVKKWKYGLWESLRMYSNKCGPELRKDAEQWINKRTMEVKNRLTLKLSLHAPRYERVRREIRDVRHAELKLHRDRMEGHKLAVEIYLDELRDNTRGLRATLKLRVSQIEDDLSETENQVDSEIKTNKIKENLNQMEEKYQHFGDGLKDILSEFREECSNKISWIRESNLNFMKAIKLFSEGGNYSSNEAEMFAEQLDELDEDLEEEASAILRRIEDIQDSSVKKVRVKVDKTKESLSVVMEELQFSDLVVGVISRVQAAIKRDTLTLKRQGKLLEARLAAAMTDTPGEHMADTWPRVFSELENRQQYLLRAVEIYQDESDGQSSGQPAFLQLSNEKRQREALQPKLARGTRRFPDYREALLGTLGPARDVESFLARVFVILWDALGEIQEAACDFYQSKSNRPVLKTELIHPEFDSFMEEILLKVKYYHAQCVDVWLEQVQEFFTTVVKLRTSANEHAQSNLRRFHEASLAALRESRANFLSEFQSKKREGLLRVGELEGRLRPHHGYQGNRHLLEELHKEVMDRSAQLGEDMEVFYNSFKESSEQSLQSYKLDMRAEGGRLSAVLEQLFRPDMTDRLNSLVDTVCSSLGAATATTHEGEAITHRRSTVAPRHKRSVRAKSFRGVALPVGHKTVNLPPQRSVECDTLYTTSIYPRLDELRQVSSRLTWTTLPTSEHQAERSQPINIDNVISDCAEDYASLQEQFTQEACSHFESYKKELTKCMEDWDRNVQSVKKLYLVSYM